jgi:hypothetical protein
MQFGQDKSDVEAMFDEGLARIAKLPRVRPVAELISLSNERDVYIGVK